MNKLLIAFFLFLLPFGWIKATASSHPESFPWKAQWINTERCQSATNTWLIYRKSFGVTDVPDQPSPVSPPIPSIGFGSRPTGYLRGWLEKRTFSFRDLLRSGRYRPLPDKGLEHHRYLALAFRKRRFQSYQQWESSFVIRGDRSGTGDRLRRELAVRLV